MMNLESAIKVFIANESAIENADDKEFELSDKYVKALENLPKTCNVEEAEKVYSLYKEVIKHNDSIEKYKVKKEQAAEIIKQHLEALDGKKIVYTLNHAPTSSGMLTYGFYLEDGEVRHNHQKIINGKDVL